MKGMHFQHAVGGLISAASSQWLEPKAIGLLHRVRAPG
jgi:hypothetical protein